MSPDDQFANRPGAVLCLRRQHARKYWLWYQIRSKVSSSNLTAEADQYSRHRASVRLCNSAKDTCNTSATLRSANAGVANSASVYTCVWEIVIQSAGPAP